MVLPYYPNLVPIIGILSEKIVSIFWVGDYRLGIVGFLWRCWLMGLSMLLSMVWVFHSMGSSGGSWVGVFWWS